MDTWRASPTSKLPAGTPVSKLDSLLGIATICLDAGTAHRHACTSCSTRRPRNRRRGSASFRCACDSPRALKNDAELEKNYALLTKDPNDLQAARAAGLALYERAQTLDEPAAARRTDLSTRSITLLDRSLEGSRR